MGRGRRWIGACLAVLVVALVVFVVAQSGDGGGGPLNAIAKAAEVTQREPGGRALISGTSETSIMSQGFTEAGSMVFDDSGRAEGTIDLKVHKTGREMAVRTIVDGTTSYLSSDAYDAYTEGKKWLKLDYSSAAKHSGASAPKDIGPEEGLRLLEEVKDAHKIGKEDIRGVPTVRYQGTLPAAEEVFGVKTHPSPVRTDVWIDARDRVRRMHLVVTTEVNEDEGSATTEMTIDYVSFGRVPKIELPDADEVFDGTSEFEARLQSAAAGQ